MLQSYIMQNLQIVFVHVCCSIRVKNLHENSDLTVLAREIIDKCKLIHPAKLPEVEQLLYYLQNRKETAPAKGKRGTGFVVIGFFYDLKKSEIEWLLAF